MQQPVSTSTAANPLTVAISDKVVGIQVIPIKLEGAAESVQIGNRITPVAIAQDMGADHNTRAWGIYRRHESGLAYWVKDEATEAEAILFAIALIAHQYPGIEIEPSPWASEELGDVYVAINRINSQKPYWVVTVNVDTPQNASIVHTEADAVRKALNLAKEHGIKIAPYYWQRGTPLPNPGL